MTPEIRIKVNSLKNYLHKEPDASTEMALHFYKVYLELLKEAEIMISLNEDLIRQQSQPKPKVASLPPF